MKRTIIMLGAVVLLAGAFGCSELDPADPTPQDPALKADEAAGNNLSFPVLWAEGVTVPLRGTFGEETFLGQSTVIDGITYWHQHDVFNEWQAASADVGGTPLGVDWIDWGDNIESKSWPDRSKIRVEMVLYQDLVEPMTGYEMGWISGLGIDEMWGTSGVTYASTQATVYSHGARLTIQKLADVDTASLAWDADLGQWAGDVSEPFYNSGVWMAGTSPLDKYSAEINVKGKVIYGMLWDTKTQGDGPGIYRLTFSLDGANGSVAANAFFDEQTQILVPVAETEKEEPSGGVVVVDTANNLTYVDLPITPARGGGGGGRRVDQGAGGGGGGQHGGR